ncbi:4Fe-4S dicluster domain-containing protein [bacterium]|nr:4Fe-4S dicluster domain-containing protein [bacterium]
MRINISRQKLKNPLVKKIQELSGQNLLACYQCGKCSAGCPSISQMDLLPNQVIRYAQLGFTDELINSKTIWVCASCMTCNVRCPKGINIAEIMEALRQILLRQRKEHVDLNKLSHEQLCELPPIALVSNFRKSSS